MTVAQKPTSTTSSDPPVDRPTVPSSGGWVVAGSLATGLVAALLLVAAPFVPAEEPAAAGAVLCGAALGWAMLALLSSRSTGQPQRWAAVPAVFMGVGGLLLVTLGSAVDGVLGWLWPPALMGLAVWMVGRIRRQLPSRGGRRLLYPVCAVLALASVGGGYQTVRQALDARAHPVPGQLVDVGGHRLHLRCTGSGSPTVVLEPGAGGMSSSLGWVTPTVAGDTRVCVYDRAGRGWSEPADTPQDGARIATDLHTLLHRADVPGPYVLAGHSFGGLYSLAFAAQYPDEVAGMVLIDSTAPAPAAAPAVPREAGAYDVVSRISALASTTARLGLGQLYGQLAADGLPPESADEVRAGSATAGGLRSTIDEYAYAGSSVEEAASLADFAAKPLVVLTAGEGNSAGWLEAQNRLAALSTGSVHRIVPDATHVDLVADQGKAGATSRAIHEVVSAIRTAAPLEQ